MLLSLSITAQVKQQTTFGEKKHGVITSCVSPNGNLVATSGDDNEIIVWNLQSGTLYRKLTGLDKITKTLAFSPDGKLLVTGGKDGKVYVWDFERSAIVNTFLGHTGDVNGLSVNVDNSTVASAGADKSVRIWDIKTGKQVTTLTSHSKEVTSVDFNPIGNKLASASADGTIKIWNTSSWICEQSINAHKDWVRCVAFSPDGKLLASCGDDKTVKVYEQNGSVRWTMTGHKDRIVELAFSPDGRFLITGSFDQRFTIWDINQGKQFFQSPSQGEIVYSVGFNPDGKSVLVSKLYKSEVTVWDVSALNIQSSVSSNQFAAVTQTTTQQAVSPQPEAVIESPSIEIKSVQFTDANKNNIIDAGEQSAVELTIKNSGKGNAQGVKLYITEQNDMKGIDFSQIHDIGVIAPGADKKLRIPIAAAEHLQTGKANFRITIIENKGFNVGPVDFDIETKKLEVPLVVIHEYALTPVNAELITKGSKFKLSMIVQNKGDATARIIKVKFAIPENAFIVSDQEFTIAELTPQEFKKLEIEVMTNTRYLRPDVPIEIFVTESTGKYGDRKIASARFDEGAQGNVSSALLALAPKTTSSSSSGNIAFSTASDVDINIPVARTEKRNCYALIIGNEDYSSYQMGLGGEVNVEFARNDAKIFKEYVNKTLGVPEENIMLLLDAKVIEMNRSIEKLNLLAKVAGADCELIFYFAGHGLPDEVTKDAFIMPVDVSGNDLKYAIKLKDLYAKLSEHPSKKVTVFLDACFSGGARNNALVAARGVKVRPKEETIKGNIVVFSASSGDQSSLPYKEKQHGIFTYHLLKKLQETKGDVTLKDLSDFANKEVSLRSIIVNNKEQTPQVNTSSEISEKWGGWKLK